MAEELRITVVDEGGELPAARAPTARPPVPGAGTARPPAMRPTATGTAGELSASSAAAVRGVTAIGITAAAAATALAAAVTVTRAYTKAVGDQVQLLSRFSAEIQAAQVESTFARQTALLRRGERIGGDLARAERIRSRFETSVIDLNTEVLAQLLKVGIILEAFQVASSKGIDGVTNLLKDGTAQSAFLAGLFGPIGVQLPGWWKIIEKGITKYLAINAEDDNDLKGMLDELLEQRQPGFETGIPVVVPPPPEDPLGFKFGGGGIGG